MTDRTCRRSNLAATISATSMAATRAGVFGRAVRIVVTLLRTFSAMRSQQNESRASGSLRGCGLPSNALGKVG